MSLRALLPLTLALSLASPLALASEDDHDRPQHFEGKEAETLEQALKNFAEYNKKLRKLLKQDELSAQEMQKVHKLTYTLENALGKMDEEIDGLKENLEAVHLASERADEDTVRGKGEAYLSTAREIKK